MPDWIIWLGGVVLFLILLSITIALHEAGHMAVAKKLGLDVPEYSIGFGPKLFTRHRNGTNYNIRALPLGGFVLIQDLRFPEKSYERGTLSRVRPWKRQLVFAAGPAVNIVLGTVLLLATLLSFPYDKGSNVIEKVQSCSASVTACGSLNAGLLPGDTVVSIDNKKVTDLTSLSAAKASKSTIDVVVLRDGKKVSIDNLQLTPKTSLMGVVVETTKAWRSPAEAWTFVEQTAYQNLLGIANLPEKVGPIFKSIVVGNRPADAPASVVSMGKTYGDMAVDKKETVLDKVQMYLVYTALFNFGLGVINLLPIMPLDGGRMFIAFMDSCRIRWAKLMKKKYTPTRETVYIAMASVSVIAVFGFMGALILSDFSLIFHGNL